MVYLRTLNSRMKDFYDVWLLARQFAFDGALLTKAIAATFSDRRCFGLLEKGEARVVEGPDENLHSLPYRGHDEERFVVAGVHFTCWDSLNRSGSNRTASHGGRLRAGMIVRIHYGGSTELPTILKFEIKQD